MSVMWGVFDGIRKMIVPDSPARRPMQVQGQVRNEHRLKPTITIETFRAAFESVVMHTLEQPNTSDSSKAKIELRRQLWEGTSQFAFGGNDIMESSQNALKVVAVLFAEFISRLKTKAIECNDNLLDQLIYIHVRYFMVSYTVESALCYQWLHLDNYMVSGGNHGYISSGILPLAEKIYDEQLKDKLSQLSDEVIIALTALRDGASEQSNGFLCELFDSSLDLVQITNRALESAESYYKARIPIFILEHGSEYTIDYIRFARDCATREKSFYKTPTKGNYGTFTAVCEDKWCDGIARKVDVMFVSGHEEGIAHIISNSLCRLEYMNVAETLNFLHVTPNYIPIIVEKAIHSYVSAVATDTKANNWRFAHVANIAESLTITSSVVDTHLRIDKVPYRSYYNSAWRIILRGLGSEFARKLGEYCDHLIRHNDEFPGKIEQAAQLAVILPDGDFFFDTYNTHLAKRLLIRGSLDPLENTYLGQLRLTCGKIATSTAEEMIKDCSLWKECAQNNGFDAHVCKFLPLVCTASAWPRIPALQVGQSVDWIPAGLKKMMTDYEAMYKSRYETRKLNWTPAASTCSVSGAFKRGDKTIWCSLRQAVILLELNDTKSMCSSPDARTAEDGLVRAKILVAHAEDEDQKFYTLNEEFSSPSVDVKVPSHASIAKSTSPEESVKNDIALLRDRVAMTQACITRIMKIKKIYQHAQLVADTCAQLIMRFQADPFFVKKQIEELIEMRYIERDPNDMKVYKYIS